MTTEELRAIDAAIHEKVMGKPVRVQRAGGGVFYWTDEIGLMGALTVPKYSAEIEQAWKVVEKLTEGEYVKVSCNTSHYHGDYCTIIAADESQRDATALVKRDVFAQSGETMAEAICRAALKTVA